MNPDQAKDWIFAYLTGGSNRQIRVERFLKGLSRRPRLWVEIRDGEADADCADGYGADFAEAFGAAVKDYERRAERAGKDSK